MPLITQTFYLYFTERRHATCGKPQEVSYPLQEWRMKDRLKTVSAALAICLNLGVDPPDVIKTNPCAKLEAWVDPGSIAVGHKAMENIGKNLQSQYETLSIRTRYKQHLDPSIDETKKFCCQLRRNAKDERVLFHYNGHGVPKPTVSGEIWVFNKNFTQYIPISLYDLQSWLGAPSLFVYDCSDAGNIIHNFNKFIEKHEADNLEQRMKNPDVQLQSYSDCIQLAACGRKETLPTNPELPADLFTCCLTTPIEIALRFFVLQNPLPSKVTLEHVAKMPGRLQERRTPMGELNWIFTAITDTIAWNTLPRFLFKKLFRQDLMVAALFRNFLLSQRIMRVHQCHPQSWPELPETHDHPLWESWDLAVEMVLSQLPALLESEEGGRSYEYKHSSFFSEQLTAFEVYLRQGALTQRAPDQLPIVLQVLLSQVHRLRALVLLSRFLDLGPWAVNLALSIGIFPYVLKLLQSAASELKPVMVFIWARILAVDQSCQGDLLKDSGYQYFIQILSPNSGIPIQNASEQRAMCAFIIAMFCKRFHQGQVVCMDPVVMTSCLTHLDDSEHALLRQWACLCISQLWLDYPEAKWLGIREMAPQRLCELTDDHVPEVRASMLHALNNFLGIPDVTDQVAGIEETIASTILMMTNDGSSMVRKELVIFFSTFVRRYENKFLVAAFEHLEQTNAERLRSRRGSSGKEGRTNGTQRASIDKVSHDSIHAAIWKHILILSVDPQPEVADQACVIVDYVELAMLHSPLASCAQPMMNGVSRSSTRRASIKHSSTEALATPIQLQTAIPPSVETHEITSSADVERTASFASMVGTLKHLAFPSTTSVATSPSAKTRSNLSPGSKSLRMSGPTRSHIPLDWSHSPDDGDQNPASHPIAPIRVPQPRSYLALDATDRPLLPLPSVFLDWSIEYFQEPQVKQSEADEPGSVEYNARRWRTSRNEKIITLTQPLKSVAGSTRWDMAPRSFDNGTQPMRTCFHQFEEHLAVTDDRDLISIWDWNRQLRLNRFSNGSPPGARLNEVAFINEDDQALLMTGSSDGVIRVFRNYDNNDTTELVSAYRALTDLVDSNVNAGLVFDWQQGQGKVIVAGDVKVIRVWNAATEVCTMDIPARSGSCITSLTSDQVSGNVIVAGFGDGALRVYDQRNRPREAMVKVWRDHKEWITDVHLQRGGARELVSGSRNGEVKTWDLRHNAPVRTLRATSDTLRSLAMHEHAPVLAT